MSTNKPIELELFDNFKLSEQREILGRYTKREALTYGSAAVAVTLAVLAAWMGGADLPVAAYTFAASIPAIAIGFIGLYKHHGRYIEEALPLILAERKAPRKMHNRLPQFALRRTKERRRPSRAERKALELAAAEDAEADEAVVRGRLIRRFRRNG